MKNVHRLVIGAALALTASRAPGAESSGVGAIRIREIYVPYDEFKARIKGDPRGAVMELGEYRALVLKALERSQADPPPPLPPLESAVVSAAYRGYVVGRTAHLEAALRVRVAVQGWVRCDLGLAFPALGSVTVNGEPGWLLVEGDGEARRMHLLLRGVGEHEAKLIFSLAVKESEDRRSIEGPLVPATGARLELEVPGAVEAEALPAHLETVIEGEHTRLGLAAGGADRFRIEWRRKRGLGQQDLLLEAEHRIAYLLRREQPSFAWDVQAVVSRRAAAEILLIEPPGGRVTRIEGALVHSWERTGSGLQVRLSEPASGAVRLRLWGMLEVPQAPAAGRFTLGPPGVSGAFASYGYLFLLEPRDARVSVEAAASAGELAVGEAVPAAPEDSGALFEGGKPARAFAFTSAEARVTAAVADLPGRVEGRSVLVTEAREGSLRLVGRVRAVIREGRVHELSLILPSPWRLSRLAELAGGGRAARPIRHEESGTADGRRITLFPERALTIERPLELVIELEHAGFDEERSWSRRELALGLPAVLGAERQRTDLGIAIPPSMDVLMPDLPGWRSLTPEEIADLGLDSFRAASEGSDGLALTAGLSSDLAGPRLAFTLVHRQPRLEVRSVTHLLATERVLRARADIQAAVVDRPIEELVLRLPPGAGPAAVVLGEGIKEVALDEATGTRTVRFSRPWLGERRLRIEYEEPLTAGAAAPIPAMEVQTAAGREGISSERFVVLQSRDAVEVEPSPGPGLTPVDVDDLPDFAEPWARSRAIAAYRFRVQGQPGTFRTRVHERAPVLARMAREVNLTTVIGSEGVSRTRAEFLLAHSRAEDLVLRLPEGARLLSMSVNGEPVRSVRPVGILPSRGTAPWREFSVPLPPRSYAQVVAYYERPAPALGAQPLGRWGSFSEEAAETPGVAVGETRWTVFHPDGFRFSFEGGNLEAEGPGDPTRGGFLATLLGRIISGKHPHFVVFEEERPLGEPASLPALTPEELRGAQGTQVSVPGAGANRLQQRDESAKGARGAGPSFQLFPQGRRLESRKMGGQARLSLSYRALDWSRFAKRAVFLGTLLLGAAMILKGKRRALLHLVGWGILMGSLLPVALDRTLPLLFVWCEALVWIGLAGGALWLFQRVAALGGAKLLVLAALFAGAPASSALLAGPGEPGAASLPLPVGGVLIPYPTGALPGGGEDPRTKVYVPYPTLLELGKLAHREGERPLVLPRDLVLGGADSTLRLDGSRYHLTSTLAVNVLTDRWVAFPLPFDRAQIARLLLDGSEAGVGQREDGPFIELKGLGTHTLAVELVGPVEESGGERRIETSFLSGAAATVRAELPAGAQVRSGTGVVRVESGPTDTIATVDLGAGGRLELTWSFPQVEGRSGSQIESRSYTRLDIHLEGYLVDRREALRVTGLPVDRAEYRIAGPWQVTEVAGPDLSEWGVVKAGAEGGGDRLQVFFARPVAEAGLRIRGRAVASGRIPLPTLVLSGAVKEESFVGLRHGARLRFLPDVLGGMRRSTLEELRRAFPLPSGEAPDRIYQLHGSAEGETVAAGPIAGEVSVATDAVALVRTDRLLVRARSRYQVTGPGPLRHEVELPAGWTARSVECAGMRDWEVVPREGGARLVVHFSGRALAGTEVAWTAERSLAVLPDPLELPPLWLLPAGASGPGAGGPREVWQWILAADEGLDLAAADPGRWTPVSLDSVPRWVELPSDASYRFAYRLARAEGALTPLQVRPARRASQLSATAVLFARVAEDEVQVNARIHFRVRLGGRDRFRLRLPPGAELPAIETRNQQSREVRPGPGGTGVEIVLQSPVTGEHAVGVTYRLPRQTGVAPVLDPIVLFDGQEPLGEVDWYVGIVQTGIASVFAASAEGLGVVEAESLPVLPEGVSARSLQPTFRAHRADWRLTLGEEEIQTEPGLPALIELAEISTSVGVDGTARTRVLLTLENRSLQFLLVELPPGASLWGVSVDGKPVAVGRGGAGPEARGQLRIPVEHVGSGRMDLEVAILYEEKPLGVPALRGSAVLAGPRFPDVRVVETVWEVNFPGGYHLARSGGNMIEIPASSGHAKRVRYLLEELKKIQKAANESASRRVREDAAREMGRLEQALGDSIAELEATNSAEQARAGGKGPSELEAQWEENDRLLLESKEANQGLRSKRQEREKEERDRKEKKEALPRSQNEQSFDDAANYQRRAWRKGKDQAQKAQKDMETKTRPEGPRGPQGPSNGALDPASAGLKGAPGLQGIEFSRRAADHEVASTAPVDPARGLKPLPESAGAGAAPGLEAPPAVKEGVVLTASRSGGDAELEVTFTRREALPRLGAWATILLLPLLAYLLHARRRRREWGY